MKILAFETSCDDTSIALFEDEKLIAMETKSQIKIHNETGGVVPEVAAREHANAIFEVLETVLQKTNTKLENIDYIGVTTNPGLLPSLLTGTTVASTISQVLKIPIIPINHIQGHIFSNFLEREKSDITFPLACLTVSGGHNEIYKMDSMWEMEKLGGTGDDAGGEAFDKAAKMMGLGYPGGPIISKLAGEYVPLLTKEGLGEVGEKSPPSVPPLVGEGGKKSLPLTGGDLEGENNTPPNIPLVRGGKELFPRVWLVKRDYNFSFSGLKSAVKREVDKRVAEKGELSLEDKREISYEFENAVTEVLAWKLVNAAKSFGLKTVMLAGGVGANTKLRDEIQKLADKNNLNFIYPKKIQYCMDNAAMIGILTYYKIKYKQFEEKIGVVKL
ncbi:tRNA (adenosine(37)-N6)-threonylcarbamoyltransferase complex transferase subunit TsaD [Candidatus Gracilibacteria bacterium]|nr:tRNA (adenosine(37)-N6)-threonylcarbamoyltransferase complex transferase subunit TsaD [Candidatus Gracilibacteria bacterium]